MGIIRRWLLKATSALPPRRMSKTSNLQILARRSLQVRVLTVLVPKNILLVFRPRTPIVYRAVVGRAIPFAQETDANGARRCSAGTRRRIGSREDRGGELDEEEKEGGRESLHCR